MATRSASTPEAVRHLTNELYTRIARDEITHVEMIFARCGLESALTIERHLLLPVDLQPLAVAQRRQPPLHNLQPSSLLEAIVSEYVFALLTEAAVESLASENAARLAAMESAHDSVSKKLEQLRQGAQEARQDEITTELLDLVTGSEAIRIPHDGPLWPITATCSRPVTTRHPIRENTCEPGATHCEILNPP